MENILQQLKDQAPKELKQRKNSFFMVSTKFYLELRYKGTINGLAVDVEFRKRDYTMKANGLFCFRHPSFEEMFHTEAMLTAPGNIMIGKNINN